METVLLFCLPYGMAWLLHFLLMTLFNHTSEKLGSKRNTFYGVLSSILYYIFIIILPFSYDLFLPLIFVRLKMYRTFAWVTSILVIATMVYAGIGTVKLAKENIYAYRFGKGFCIALAFLINLFNVNLICPAIKSLFMTFYEIESHFAFDMLTLAVFAFDVGLLVYMLKQVKNRNKEC